MKEKDIFISHASKDKKIIDSFIDLILSNGLSININKIFSTTTDGTKIKSGDDWRDSIRSHIISAKVSFLIISPNYKESEVCMNEMGALWVSGKKVIPLIVEPINYETVGVIQQPKQIENLLDGKSLDRIKDILQDKLSIPPDQLPSDKWSAKREEFLILIKEYLKKNPFDTPMDRNNFEVCIKRNHELEATIKIISEEKSELFNKFEALKKVKDKNDLDKFTEEYEPSPPYLEFKKISKEISKCLKSLDSIIIGFAFLDYSGKNVPPLADSWAYKNELREAIAQEYINEDDYTINWEATQLMQNLNKALKNIETIIKKHGAEDAFRDNFVSDFDNTPFSITNKIFWEKVFNVNVSVT